MHRFKFLSHTRGTEAAEQPFRDLTPRPKTYVKSVKVLTNHKITSIKANKSRDEDESHIATNYILTTQVNMPSNDRTYQTTVEAIAILRTVVKQSNSPSTGQSYPSRPKCLRLATS